MTVPNIINPMHYWPNLGLIVRKPLTFKRKHLVVFSVLLIASAMILFAYRSTEAWVCINCARIEYRETLGTFPHIRVVLNTTRETRKPLTVELDPSGKCEHTWRRFTFSMHNWFVKYEMGPSYFSEPISAEPDFHDFISESPGVLSEIRCRIERSAIDNDNHLRRYLIEKYEAWKLAGGSTGAVPRCTGPWAASLNPRGRPPKEP